MKKSLAVQQRAIEAVKAAMWTLCGCMALGAPSIAVPAPVSPAQQCLTDLAAFDATMNKDGYWIDGEGHGYGYPVYGYGFSYMGRSAELSGYGRARPGYEVRTLLASARILAQRGAQQVMRVGTDCDPRRVCQVCDRTSRRSAPARGRADLAPRANRRGGSRIPQWHGLSLGPADWRRNRQCQERESRYCGRHSHESLDR
jgi:hypothetical protein